MADDKPKTNYPGNSHKQRDGVEPQPQSEEQPQQKRVERVVSEGVVQKKPGLGKKIAETFTGDDMRSVGHYVLFEVLIPAAKTMIVDAMTQGIERRFYGDSRPRSSSSRSSYTAYNKMGSSYGSARSIPVRYNEEPRSMSPRARATHDFGDIILHSRGEAEEVLERLIALVEQYDVATVSDLYEMVGITGTFTDDKWGWGDLRDSRVKRVREGYLLELPRPTPID